MIFAPIYIFAPQGVYKKKIGTFTLGDIKISILQFNNIQNKKARYA
jgi:hypothetical protein